MVSPDTMIFLDHLDISPDRLSAVSGYLIIFLRATGASPLK